MSQYHEQTFVDAIKKQVEIVIKEKIDQHIQEAIHDAQVKIESDIREETGAICGRVFNCFQYEMDAHRILITVDFKNTKDNQ